MGMQWNLLPVPVIMIRSFGLVLESDREKENISVWTFDNYYLVFACVKKHSRICLFMVSALCRYFLVAYWLNWRCIG